jgi:hypothetical protein
LAKTRNLETTQTRKSMTEAELVSIPVTKISFKKTTKNSKERNKLLTTKNNNYPQQKSRAFSTGPQNLELQRSIQDHPHPKNKEFVAIFFSKKNNLLQKAVLQRI